MSTALQDTQDVATMPAAQVAAPACTSVHLDGNAPATASVRTIVDTPAAASFPAYADIPATASLPAIIDIPATVDIYDQTYHLRGQDPDYIRTLAEMVDSKMRAVAAGGTTVDSLRVAVLAALNIADELMRVQSSYRALDGSVQRTESTLRDRTENLSGLLDSILDERKLG